MRNYLLDHDLREIRARRQRGEEIDAATESREVDLFEQLAKRQQREAEFEQLVEDCSPEFVASIPSTIPPRIFGRMPGWKWRSQEEIAVESAREARAQMRTPTDRLAEIRAFRRGNPDAYDADKQLQNEELKLLTQAMHATAPSYELESADPQLREQPIQGEPNEHPRLA
jgi:hypothetical protein